MLPDIESPTMFVVCGPQKYLVGYIVTETPTSFLLRNVYRWTARGLRPLLEFDYEDRHFLLTVSKDAIISYGRASDDVTVKLRNIAVSQV